jgi:hypothetical protein
MKRIRIAGLCLVAAFAMSAAAAASAWATAPEYGRCKAKTGGKYSDAGCTKAVKTGGKYEWTPGAEKAKFTSKGGVGKLSIVSGAGVECKTESSAGEFVPGNNKEEAGVIVKFNGCTALKNPCTTSGRAKGELVTNELEGTVGWGVKAKKITDLELFPAKSVTSGLFIEFSCIGLVVKVRGHVLVPIKNDKMTATETLKFSAAKGIQKPEKWEESPGKTILEASFKGGPFEQAGQNITSTVTGEEQLELNAVV